MTGDYELIYLYSLRTFCVTAHLKCVLMIRTLVPTFLKMESLKVPISVTLFMIAINDIAINIPNSVDHCLYVDDLTMFTSASSIDVCKRRLQNAVDTVTHTAAVCGFRFSIEKTKVVDFCRLPTPHVCPDLTMYGAPIQKDVVEKFLGLYYDSYLTWRRYIMHLSGQCRMSLNAIKH